MCLMENKKNVDLLSSFTGEMPFRMANRFDKKQKQSDIDIREIGNCKKHMGMVYLLDGLIGR